MRAETVWDEQWNQIMQEGAIFIAMWDVQKKVPVDGHAVAQKRKYGANRPAMPNAAAEKHN